MRKPSAEIIALAKDIVRDSATCGQPFERARVLPGESYVSQQFWEFEKWAIFSREWLFVGHVNQVPAPGDHIFRRILDEPILVVRDHDNKVRVLSAVCQHRGHPIVGGLKPGPEDAGCLNAQRLVCPYHNWVYNLDGKLIGAPSMERTAPMSELRAEIRLPEIRSEIFHGLIFMNFDDRTRNLSPTLAKLDHELAGMNVAEMMPLPPRIDKELRWNWKVHHENALEAYHTDYVHKNTHNSAPSHLTRFKIFEAGDGQIMMETGFAAGQGDLYSKEGATIVAIDGLRDDQRRRVLFVSVLPTFFAVVQPANLNVTLLLPRDANVMDTHRFGLYSKSAVETPGFEETYKAVSKARDVIIGEDRTTQMAVQEGHLSRFSPRGRLSWLEATIPQMNEWLLDRYRSALEERAAAE